MNKTVIKNTTRDGEDIIIHVKTIAQTVYPYAYGKDGPPHCKNVERAIRNLCARYGLYPKKLQKGNVRHRRNELRITKVSAIAVVNEMSNGDGGREVFLHTQKALKAIEKLFENEEVTYISIQDPVPKKPIRASKAGFSPDPLFTKFYEVSLKNLKRLAKKIKDEDMTKEAVQGLTNELLAGMGEIAEGLSQ